MMVVSEMMTTRQVANDMAGKYKWGADNEEKPFKYFPPASFRGMETNRNLAKNWLVGKVHVECRQI